MENLHYKLKATIEGGTVVDLFIDKSKYSILINSNCKLQQEGTAAKIESYPSDYTDTKWNYGTHENNYICKRNGICH